MVEANPVKFYFAKYILLVLALIQLSTGSLFLFLDPFTLPNLVIDSSFVILGIVLVILYFIISDKIKRVAVSDDKLVVMDDEMNWRFEWPEVKYFKIVPFINLCKIKIRGKRKSIYFFVSRNITPLVNTRRRAKKS